MLHIVTVLSVTDVTKRRYTDVLKCL